MFWKFLCRRMIFLWDENVATKDGEEVPGFCHCISWFGRRTGRQQLKTHNNHLPLTGLELALRRYPCIVASRISERSLACGEGWRSFACVAAARFGAPMEDYSYLNPVILPPGPSQKRFRNQKQTHRSSWTQEQHKKNERRGDSDHGDKVLTLF
jgi:hypothetical protein